MNRPAKPVVLVFLDHYLPGFKAGGPVRSIVNAISCLQGDFSFLIVTSDRDLGDATPYSHVALDRWVPIEGGYVRYCSPGQRRLIGISRLLRETPHDVVYLNSFFSLRSTIFPLLARRLGMIPDKPLVLAPRGEFSLGALALRKLKKRSYMAIAKAVGLLHRLTWQASTPHEASDIRAAMGHDARIRIACNLPGRLSEQMPIHRPRRDGEVLRILFLSRVSPKKNLDFALQVLSQVRSAVRFDVFGPVEDSSYFEYCRSLVSRLPENISVRWGGAIEPSAVSDTMAAYDLFFLPTRGENYGHVIAEALGAGTPALVSDTTPWRGLSRLGIGHDISLDDPMEFIRCIEDMASRPTEYNAAQRVRVAAYARQLQDESVDVQANRALFLSALAPASATL